MDVEATGEFGLIERIRQIVGGDGATVGLGDDAAVLPLTPGCEVVVATDVCVEDVHFRLDWSSPSDVGWKAVAVNLSDIAAMGAVPRWLLVGLSVPGSTSAGVVEDLYRGMVDAGREHSVRIVGGDTVRGDRLVVAVTVLGEVDGPSMLRSGARPGNVLAVTGPLGRAAAGVLALKAELDIAPGCVAAHRRPQARVSEGMALRASGVVSACMDVSDGLLSDVRRLATASGVGIELDRDAVPVGEGVGDVARAIGRDPADVALSGGEELELLVALAPGDLDRAGIDLLPVGRVVDEGLWLVRDGGREPLPEGGWDHFRPAG